MKKIGYLGPEGSYSELAADVMCGGAEKIAYGSFYLVMQSLVKGETDAAVLPIENTLNGGVLQNIDLLQGTDGVIAVRECTLKIDHRLITLAGADRNKITCIYSHQQALAQCSRFISENYPHARLVATTSTVSGMEKIKSPHDAGIVGGHFSAEGYELSPLCISDEPNNYTHFLLVERGAEPSAEHSERIYFSFTCRHEPGALLDMLNVLSAVNMTKIESRPIKDRPGEYRFFIEAEADYKSAEAQSVIGNLKKRANTFKLLGAY